VNSNLIKLPGLVDVHVHLREPGGVQKEDFETGTKAAVAGGYTQILDMPNNIPPTIDLKSLDYKIALAKNRIYCDVGFNFGGITGSIKEFPKIYKKVFGLKVYMNQTTGTLLVENPKEREQIFKSWGSKMPIMVHAEGKTVENAIKLAKKYKRKLHICHISYEQIEIIDKAKKEGLSVSSEVCPHHLFLSKFDIKNIGSLGIMKPPLPPASDQKKLWDNIDKIDMISTDHAPHTLEEKREKPPKFGVPGLETTLPLMLNAVHEKKISLNRLIEMLSTNPARIFHLPEQKDTYILVNENKKYKITAKNFFTKNKWSPFEGLEGRGEVKKVVLRSKTVFEDGKFIGKPSGRVISPKK